MTQFKSITNLIVVCLCLILFVDIQPAYAAENILFAKPNAVGQGDCTTWADACTLQTALGDAGFGDEIWVMQGTHVPGTLRTDTFQLVNGVEVYGGFDGTETVRNARDPATNLTILSGDIDGDDSQNPITNLDTVTGNTNNSYHVVTGSGTDATAILDGFTISAGNADADGGYPGTAGAGIFNNAGSPTLTNITIIGNRASDSGGGINNSKSSPTLTNVTISNNSAGLNGGGIANFVYDYITSSPTLTNVTISSNSAGNNGGGMVNVGRYYSYLVCSSPSLNNVTMSGNSAGTAGGGIYNNYGSPTLKNVILWGNTAASGSEISNSSTTIIIDSVVQYGCPGSASCTNVINFDPELAPLADNGGFTQTMALGPWSSAVDTGGVNAACALDDQRGVTRPQDGDGDSNANCDIGAYEVAPGSVEPPILTTPANNEVLYECQPKFTWSAVSEAGLYEIDVIPFGANGTHLNGTAISNSFTPSITLRPDIYYWQARAFNGFIASDWSTGNWFTINIGAPNNVTPNTNYGTYDLRPTFDWSDVCGADGYDLYAVRYDETGTPQTAIYTGTTVSEYTPPSNLTPGVYAWYVRAKSGTEYGPWNTFYWLVLFIGAPDLQTPVTNDLVTPYPEFSWTTLAGATAYDLFVVKIEGEGNSTAIYEEYIPTTSYTDSDPLDSGIYAWYVRARTVHWVGPWTNFYWFVVP